MPTQIRKILITAPSSNPDVVQLTTATLPTPTPNEIQVQVLYSGFSGTDINMRLGVYPRQKTTPLTPGYCLIGRVYLIGSASLKFKEGDIVAALTIYDAEATYANVPEKYLMPLPQNIDLAKTCALIVDWTTAYGMTTRAAKITKSDRVFIHGMSGAVGLALMSLCLFFGATVYGTASARNHEEIRRLGGVPFVYTDKKWIGEMKALESENEGKGLTAVFDPLGFESWDESYSVLSQKEGSVLVGYGGNLEMFNNNSTGDGDVQKMRGVMWPVTKLLARNLMLCKRSTKFFYIDRDQKTFAPDFEALVGMLGKGEIDVCIKREMSLEEVPEAHREWNGMRGMGSLVVKIAD